MPPPARSRPRSTAGPATITCSAPTARTCSSAVPATTSWTASAATTSVARGGRRHLHLGAGRRQRPDRGRGRQGRAFGLRVRPARWSAVGRRRAPGVHPRSRRRRPWTRGRSRVVLLLSAGRTGRGRRPDRHGRSFELRTDLCALDPAGGDDAVDAGHSPRHPRRRRHQRGHGVRRCGPRRAGSAATLDITNAEPTDRLTVTGNGGTDSIDTGGLGGRTRWCSRSADHAAGRAAIRRRSGSAPASGDGPRPVRAPGDVQVARGRRRRRRRGRPAGGAARPPWPGRRTGRRGGARS